MLNRKIDNEIDVHFSNSKKALFLTGAAPRIMEYGGR